MSIMAAVGIAEAVGLTDWVKGLLGKSDSGAAKVASKVLNFATDITGETNHEKALTKLSANPELAAKLKTKLMDNEHEIKMAPYADRNSAREMHKINNEQADKIAERIMKQNLPYIFVLLILNVSAVYFFKEHGPLLAVISNVLGMTIKSLFDERFCVTGFYFGSSMGSKNKDKKDL